MPEGHVVHADARRFGSRLAGHAVRASSPQGRFTSGAQQLDGRELLAAEAYGKHLFLRFAGRPEPILHVHLGLIGSWTWWDAAGAQLAGRPTRTPDDSGVRLRLTSVASGESADLRAMTTCAVIPEPVMEAVVGSLGPDPIRPDADPAAAWAKVSRSRTAVGTLLLDQAVLAGAGLIWRCEAPFLAGISPYRPGHAVTEHDWATLWHELCRIMRAAADSGPQPFFVFRRTGQPCLRCGTPVESAVLGGRKVWWCPRHQPH